MIVSEDELDRLRRELRGAVMIIAAMAKRQPDKTLRLSAVELHDLPATAKLVFDVDQLTGDRMWRYQE